MSRRIVTMLMAALLCTVLLAGCGEKTIRGEVVEVNTDGQLSFVLDQEVGGLITIQTDEDTHIFSWIDEAPESDFREGNVDGMMVLVTLKKFQREKTASQVLIEQLKIRDYYTLADGTKVDLTIGLNEHTYSIPNVTELLQIRDPIGPENVQIVGQESLRDLTEEAREEITAYYDAQGLFYDEFQTLEDAYEAFCTWDKFYAFYLSQEMTPIASSDDVMYILTDFMWDRGMEGSDELRFCAAFDKKTGEEIPMTDIFTCKPEEIFTKMIEICDLGKDAPIDEMKAAFKPEYMVIFPENMEIIFPEEALPEYGLNFGMGIDLDNEALLELIHPWAVPNKEVTS